MQHAVALNTIINILQGRVNARTAADAASRDPAEMPQDISYPLLGPRELEKQEVWLENAANTPAKTKMVRGNKLKLKLKQKFGSNTNILSK